MIQKSVCSTSTWIWIIDKGNLTSRMSLYYWIWYVFQNSSFSDICSVGLIWVFVDRGTCGHDKLVVCLVRVHMWLMFIVCNSSLWYNGTSVLKSSYSKSVSTPNLRLNGLCCKGFWVTQTSIYIFLPALYRTCFVCACTQTVGVISSCWVVFCGPSEAAVKSSLSSWVLICCWNSGRNVTLKHFEWVNRIHSPQTVFSFIFSVRLFLVHCLFECFVLMRFRGDQHLVSHQSWIFPLYFVHVNIV